MTDADDTRPQPEPEPSAIDLDALEAWLHENAQPARPTDDSEARAFREFDAFIHEPVPEPTG